MLKIFIFNYYFSFFKDFIVPKKKKKDLKYFSPPVPKFKKSEMPSMIFPKKVMRQPMISNYVNKTQINVPPIVVSLLS